MSDGTKPLTVGLDTPQPSAQTELKFLIFWVGQIFSILGSWVVNFTINWWIVSTYQDAGTISLYSTLVYIPFVLLSPFAGVWVDRWNKKRTILVADTIIAFSTLGYLVAYYLDFTAIWLFIILGAVNTSSAAFHQPAISAMVPLMVRKKNLTRVNGLKTFSGGGVRLMGPVITGILIRYVSLNQMLWIDIITYFIATVALLSIKLPKEQIIVSAKNTNVKSEIGKFWVEFRDGFNIIKDTPVVKYLVILTFIANFLHTPWQTLNTLFIQTIHSATEKDYSFLSLMLQIGLLLGSFIALLKIKWRKKHLWVVAGNILIGVFTIISAVASPGDFWVMGISNLCVGITLGTLLALYYGILQGEVSQEFQGRIYSFDAALSVSIMPIAMAFSGPIAEVTGIVPLVVFSEGITIIFSIIMVFLARKTLGDVK